MSIGREDVSQSSPLSPSWGGWLTWFALCLVVGLLAAPAFYGVPSRMKFIGLHAWALAGVIATGCTWLAVRQGLCSSRWIAAVSVVVALAANLLQAHWGYLELKAVTAQRMPMIPLPVNAGSPEEVAQSLLAQKQLAEALVPSFRDFQRRRMSAPIFLRIRPVPLWAGEMVLAAVVAWLTSCEVFRQMTTRSDSSSLNSASAPFPLKAD